MASSLNDLVPNAQLGHYTIVEHIAEGGMGHVFRAFEPSLSREVAIKVLKAELADEPSKIALFDQEAQNIAALRHSNIVPIYFVGHQGELHYFAMPFIAGSTLDDWVEKGAPMDAEQGLWVLTQGVEALDWAYKHGVIHLDIKPSNFLVDSTGILLLTDFGLARTLGQALLEDEDECYGTPAYMCPEQILQQKTDQRSDIYSLGATVYHLMTCHFLYDYDSVTELVQAHLEDPFPYEKAASLGLSPGWINLFDRMTQKSPEDRFQNYDELRQALSNVERLGPVRRKQRVTTSGLASVPLRSSAPKEYIYGLLSPKLTSWAGNEIDQSLCRGRSDTLSGLEKPRKPLGINALIPALKELGSSSGGNSEVSDLAEALEILPPIDDYVMALANTRFARTDGSSQTIIARDKAVRALGTELTSQLILTGAMMRDDIVPSMEFQWFPLWQHSVSTGVIAKFLLDVVVGDFIPGTGWQDNRRTKLTSILHIRSVEKARNQAYLAGLVHDIGKMALAEIASYPYYAAMRLAAEKHCGLELTEPPMLGMDHMEAGALWLGMNGFDSSVKHAVAVHQDLDTKCGLLGSAVGLANEMVKIHGLGFSGSPVINHRELWNTHAWKELHEAIRNPDITGELMEEHFLPMVAELPLLEPPAAS